MSRIVTDVGQGYLGQPPVMEAVDAGFDVEAVDLTRQLSALGADLRAVGSRAESETLPVGVDRGESVELP